jgi:hypothetical protein
LTGFGLGVAIPDFFFVFFRASDIDFQQ